MMSLKRNLKLVKIMEMICLLVGQDFVCVTVFRGPFPYVQCIVRCIYVSGAVEKSYSRELCFSSVRLYVCMYDLFQGYGQVWTMYSYTER